MLRFRHNGNYPRTNQSGSSKSDIFPRISHNNMACISWKGYPLCRNKRNHYTLKMSNCQHFSSIPSQKVSLHYNPPYPADTESSSEYARR